MKVIFDFDDVLFSATRFRKEALYPFFEKLGIPQADIDAYYQIVRLEGFSVKNLLAHFKLDENLNESILHNAPIFVNQDLVEIAKSLGKENCFIATFGNESWQIEKIDRSGITPLFNKIFYTQESKKDFIHDICAQFPEEKIIFVDDKAKHFEDIDFSKCPNLKTVLFDDQGVENLRKEIATK